MVFILESHQSLVFRAFQGIYISYFVIATKHGFTSVTISFHANQTAWEFQPTKKEEHVQNLQQEKEDVYISINSMFAMFMVIHIFSLRFPEETWASKDPSGGPSCPALSELRIAMTAPQGGGVGCPNHPGPMSAARRFFSNLSPHSQVSTVVQRLLNFGFYVKTPNRMNVSHITIHQQNREKSTFEFLGGNHFWAARPKICFFSDYK